MKQIKFVQVDLMSANNDSHTHVLGEPLRCTPPNGFLDGEEIIIEIKFETIDNYCDLVIRTDKGSVISYNPKYIIQWGLK